MKLQQFLSIKNLCAEHSFQMSIFETLKLIYLQNGIKSDCKVSKES